MRRGRGDQFDVIGREKPPPKRGGVCERVPYGLSLSAEKPPPKWGGGCEGLTEG